MRNQEEYIEGWKVVLGVGCVGFLVLSVICFISGSPLWGIGCFSASFIAGIILGVVLHGEHQERLYKEEQKRLEAVETQETRLERERRRRLEVMEQLRTMSDGDFGCLVGGILERMGYEPEADSGDPFELRLSKGDDVVALASWRSWRQPLTAERVIELSERAQRIGASGAYLVTMGDVPPAAQNVAEARKVSIIATGRLVAMALDVLEPAEDPAPEGALRFEE